MTQFNSNVYDNNVGTFREFLNKVFSIMALGLAISGIVAFVVSVNFYNIVYLFGNSFYIFMLVCLFAELGVGIYFSARLMKMSKTTAWVCYIVYSALTGLSLAIIIEGYTASSVLFAFVATVILFVCMAVIGHTTKVDLSRFSSIFMVGLIAIIITSLLNMLFFHSATINYVMTFVGVLVFLGLIAYDMQKLREIYYQGGIDTEIHEKMMLYGAFSLYLDFINLFIRLLQIFGRRSNSKN